MKISVVTISYNQADFLEKCLDSVAVQEGPWEHIIVDPGSTDGSRELIERRKHQFSHIILGPDKGPADGLNKGFARATGDVLFFLNSDDTIASTAFNEVRNFFSSHPDVGVVAGHGHILDKNGVKIRGIWSSLPTRIDIALGTSVLVQQSTYFRVSAFESVGGFNVSNRTSWDGELFEDMFLNGIRFALIEKYMSGFRIHGASITGGGAHAELLKPQLRKRYEEIMGRKMGSYASLLRLVMRIRRLIERPEIFFERVARGSVLSAVSNEFKPNKVGLR